MNAIRFNDSFTEFYHSNACLNKAECKRMLYSPLIKWSEPTNADFRLTDHPEAFFPNGCPRLPFRGFRVSGHYCDLSGQFLDFRAWVSQAGLDSDNPGYTVAIEVQKLPSGSIRELGLRKTLIIASAFFTGGWSTCNNPKIMWMIGRFDVKSRKVYKFDNVTSDAVWILCGEWLHKLAIDFYNPHLYLCKKSPALPQGKSINWQVAREHYVLIHKSHSANKVESIGKALIHDEATVDRVAHSRRAHFRLLSSPRFRNKHGQRVWVKSSWVGPKEWTDRSGQIYRIVERSNLRTETINSLLSHA